MFGKYSNLFRSRWKAVWWALGVLLTAYCSVPSRDETDQTGVAPPPAAPQHARNPWALDPPPAGSAPRAG